MKTEWSFLANLPASPYWRFRFHDLGQGIDPLECFSFPPRPPRCLERDEGLVVGGRGPIWFYHAFLEQFYDVRWCAVDVPQWGAAVVVRARPDSPVGAGRLVRAFDIHAGREVEPTLEAFDPEGPAFEVQPIRRPGVDESRGLRLCFSGNGKWIAPHWLAKLDHSLPRDELERRAPSVLELSGPAPIWLAVAALHQVSRLLPDAAVLLDLPVAAGAIVLRSGRDDDFACGQVLPDQPRGSPAPCAALVGDPQSGKSTLSWKIYHELLRRGVQTYRLDCDAQAPTAPWGMSLHGEAERRRYKQERGGWTSEDVHRLTRQVRALKRSRLDLVLLDMPGGDFRADPPDRMPADRVELFREVDYFVRLDKNAAAREGWTAALAAAALEDRIVASVETLAEDGDESWPSGKAAGVAAYRVHRLDRARFREPTPAVERLTEHLAEKAGVLPAQA